MLSTSTTQYYYRADRYVILSLNKPCLMFNYSPIPLSLSYQITISVRVRSVLPPTVHCQLSGFDAAV